MNTIALQARNLSFAYFNTPVLREVSLALHSGERVGLIGPNGSGKTTLLRCLSGVLLPSQGEVSLDGLALRRLSRQEIARRIAVVPQELLVPFAFTVREMVGMGRLPHVAGGWQALLRGENQADRRAIEAAMLATGTVDLADRLFNELSGGERQRVMIALALAQEPEVLLLDEPTVHLDLAHQVEVLELIARLNGERGFTVLAVLHDLNLAALYFPRLVLLEGGRIVGEGTPAQVLSEETIARVFGATVRVQPHPTADRPHIIVLPG